MLDDNELLAFMLRRRLMGAGDVVGRSVSFVDASRRHHNCKISRERATSFFVKQGAAVQKCESLVREAGVYRLFHTSGSRRSIRQYLPRFVLYDPRQHVLIVEWVNGAKNFRDYHAGAGRFPRHVARLAGRALGALHRFPLSEEQMATPCSPPWVFAIHRPDLSLLRDASSAALDVVRIVQESQRFGQLMDALAREWRASAWTHRDIKWENCIVSSCGTPRKSTQVRIVDWELAGAGDPAWDAGSFMSAYLTFWLDSLPVTSDADPAGALAFALHPLETMQGAIAAFWGAYARSMRWTAEQEVAFLHRATRYSAARMVQTAFEQMQSAPQLTGSAVIALQLALNILERPQEAAIRLLGIIPAAAAAGASR